MSVFRGPNVSGGTSDLSGQSFHAALQRSGVYQGLLSSLFRRVLCSVAVRRVKQVVGSIISRSATAERRTLRFVVAIFFAVFAAPLPFAA